MKAEIICVGTELLLGDIVNTNAQFLSRQLSQLGISMFNQQVVGDNAQRLKEAVKIAKGRSDIIILSGGLGPTDDDLTKQSVAEVFNDELIYSEDVERDIKSYFDKMQRPMTDNNKKQAFIPKKGKYLKNENGTAPGIIFIDNEKMAVLLPGPPKELQPMVEKQVIPLLKKLVRGVIVSRYVKTIGIGESLLETKIYNILSTENPTAALYASAGEVTIRITAKADDMEDANQMLDRQVEQLKEVIGDYIYGIDVESIEDVLVKTLIKIGKTVSTAESCTGGLVSSRITSVAGASNIFELGICTYSDKQKNEIFDIPYEILNEYSAVSEKVAVLMAKNMQKIAESDYSISVTGYAGPTGQDVGLVYIAVATKEKVYLAEHHFAGTRERIVLLSSQYALDMLRRVMFNLPLEYMKEIEPEPIKKKKKKYKSVLRGFLIFLAMMIVAATIAFGYLWWKNDGNIPNFPYFPFKHETAPQVQAIENIIQSRQEKDFFLQGFELDTVKMLSGLSAQDLNVKGWITFKNLKKEFAVIDESFKLDSSVFYSDASKENPIIMSGFSKLLPFDFSDTQSIKNNSKFLLFEQDEYSLYDIFAASKLTDTEKSELYNAKDIDTLIKIIENQNFYKSILPVSSSDKIIMLEQVNANSTIVCFAKEILRENVEKPIQEDPEADKVTPSPSPSSSPSASTSPSPSPSGSPSSSASPSISPSPSAAITPRPTKTPTPTGSPSPTKAPTPTPAVPTEKPTPTPIKPTAAPTPTPPPPPSGPMLTVTMNGEVITGTATEILSKVVAKEMTSTWNPEALKAQAIATHTYLRYQYSMGNTAPSVPGRNSPSQSVINAVSQVSDKIMTVGGRAVYTPYFASSAGRTNASVEVWGTSHSHLQSVESKYDSQASGFNGSYSFTKSEVIDIVEGKIGPIDPELDPKDWFVVESKTSGGYVNVLRVCGYNTYFCPTLGRETSITGRWIRDDIFRTGDGMVLRSAAFDVSYDSENEIFTFSTYGYGHGAGMSQWGAQLYAKNEGWNYEQILTHYYTGVAIQSI